MSETKVPALPPIPANTDPALYKFLQALQQITQVREGQKGDSLDANVTFRDLIDAGLAVSSGYRPNPGVASPISPSLETDSSPPPDPFDIKVTASVECNMITWALPERRSNLAYIKVWRSVDNNLGNATIVGTGAGFMYVDYDVSTGTNYHYWLQSVSIYNVEGNVVDSGTATPTADPTLQLTQLKPYGVDGLPFYHVPQDIVINGVTLPKGTYMWNAVIGTASIGTAQIKDAAITSAKIATLTADKITFNQAQGQVFNAAVITGGLIQGTTISGNTIIGGEVQGARIWAGGSSTSPNVEIDGATGHIRSFGTSNTDATQRRYSEIDDGDVATYEYIPQVGFARYKSINNVESGQDIPNNTEVILEGYWLEQPNVIVTPSNVRVYKNGVSSSQSLSCTASDLARLGNDPTQSSYYRWKFTAKAELTAAGGSQSYSANQVVFNEIGTLKVLGNIAFTNYSSNYTFPANVKSVTFTVAVACWIVTDNEGPTYRVNTGTVQALFQVNVSGSWVTLYTSPTINNDVTVNTAYEVAKTPKSFTFTFTTSPNSASGQCRVVFVSTNGGTASGSDSGQAWPGSTYAQSALYEYVNSYSVKTTDATSLATGTLNYIAIGR